MVAVHKSTFWGPEWRDRKAKVHYWSRSLVNHSNTRQTHACRRKLGKPLPPSAQLWLTFILVWKVDYVNVKEPWNLVVYTDTQIKSDTQNKSWKWKTKEKPPFKMLLDICACDYISNGPNKCLKYRHCCRYNSMYWPSWPPPEDLHEAWGSRWLHPAFDLTAASLALLVPQRQSDHHTGSSARPPCRDDEDVFKQNTLGITTNKIFILKVLQTLTSKNAC